MLTRSTPPCRTLLTAFVLVVIAVSFVGMALASEGVAWAEERSKPPRTDEEFDAYQGVKIVINIPEFTLFLYNGDALVKSYPIAVGKPQSQSLIGIYHIVSKVTNPTWNPPRGGDPVPPGPNNPLGRRWLGLNAHGYGIHGNNNPSSIGKAVSLGCIRMRNPDIEEVFKLVSIGTPVKFVYETVVFRTETGPETASGSASGGEVPVTRLPSLVFLEDIYRKGTNTFEEAVRALAAAGIPADAVSEAALRVAAAQAARSRKPAAVAVPFVVKVEVNGSELFERGFIWEGRPLLPLIALAGVRGTELSWERTAGGWLQFTVNGRDGLANHRWDAGGVQELGGEIYGPVELAKRLFGLFEPSEVPGLEAGAPQEPQDRSPAKSQACATLGIAFSVRLLGITVTVDGVPVARGAQLRDGKLLVRLRGVCDLLGLAPYYDPAAKAVTVAGVPVNGVVINGETWVEPGEIEGIEEGIYTEWSPSEWQLRIYTQDHSREKGKAPTVWTPFP